MRLRRAALTLRRNPAFTLTALAEYIPAVHAGRVNPATALRAEK
jgi:ABC-type lipoprotein release transport system permease subunit